MTVTPPPRPKGYLEILATFGDIRGYTRPDGTLRPDWERTELGLAALPAPLPLSWDPEVRVARIRCHAKLISLVEATFWAIEDAGAWRALHAYGGCFAFRPMRGNGSKLSTHA